MGYTHYWNFKKNPIDLPGGEQRFKLAVDLVRQFLDIVREKGIEICSWDGEGEPKINDNEINFNGTREGDLCHENCHIKLDDADGYEFNFCKTAEKPYDLLVCLTLMAFKHYFGDDFDYSSDGVTKESIVDPENLKYWKSIGWEPVIEEGWQDAYDVWDAEMSLA